MSARPSGKVFILIVYKISDPTSRRTQTASTRNANQSVLFKEIGIYLENLTWYVPCVVTNCMNKPTRCTLCIYSTIFFVILHVSNDHFVYYREFIIYCICSSVQTMQKCLTARSYGWNQFVWFVQRGRCSKPCTPDEERSVA